MQVTQGRKGPLVSCWAGCTYQEVFDSLGVKWGDLADTDSTPVRRREKWEQHLDAALKAGATPVRVGDGVYNGKCSCGGGLYVGRAGAACDRGCRISLEPVEPQWENPVELARAFGCTDLKPTGEGVFVGTCPSCRGWLSAGPAGAFCSSNCPVEAVGSVVRYSGDVMKGAEVQKRVLTILGCIEKKNGVSKAGRAWTLYQVHANDENGQPIQHELTSFEMLPQGQGEYWVEVRESQFGTQYSVKTSLTPAQREIADLREKVEQLIRDVAELKGSPVPPATAAAQAMTTATTGTVTEFTPKVVESEGIPF